MYLLHECVYILFNCHVFIYLFVHRILMLLISYQLDVSDYILEKTENENQNLNLQIESKGTFIYSIPVYSNIMTNVKKTPNLRFQFLRGF